MGVSHFLVDKASATQWLCLVILSLAGSLSVGQRSRSSSFGEQAGGQKEAGSKEESNNNVLKVRAIAPHTAGSNPTLLQFGLGDIVIVLIPEAQNGWLYGRLEGTST